MEDSRIVDLYIQRNESAVTETSRKYGTFLRSIAQRITGDKPTAEECENDAYLEAWNTIPPHEPRSYLAAYLSRIVRNISLNRCVERRSLKRSATVCALTDELEMCLPSQGFQMTEPRTCEVSGVDWRLLTLARRDAPNLAFAYTFFNQDGFRTDSHVARIFRDVWDRSVRGRIDRWAMVTVNGYPADSRLTTSFLSRLWKEALR